VKAVILPYMVKIRGFVRWYISRQNSPIYGAAQGTARAAEFLLRRPLRCHD